MKKTPHPRDLLESMASLMSLNIPLFASGNDIESFAKRSYVFKTYLKSDDITYHHSTRTQGITVETEDGVVKLEGKAGSRDEKPWSPNV